MHPRTCVSAISTFRLSLDDDLAFWDAHGITNVGVSVAKLEAFGWETGTAVVADAVGKGLQVVGGLDSNPPSQQQAGQEEPQQKTAEEHPAGGN